MDQAKALVSGFVHELVRQPERWNSADIILKGCFEACRSYNLSLSSLLQEQSAEGHTPLYWAVLRSAPRSSSSDLLSALMNAAAPLSSATMSEIRLACLLNSDQALFQRIRRMPAFYPLSGPERMLLGAVPPSDEIEVDELPGDEGRFAVYFRIPMFQKRLKVLKHVDLQFIARGRIWSLKFMVAGTENARVRPAATAGTWVITLSMLEHGKATWIDSRLIFDDLYEPVGSPASRRPRPLMGRRMGSQGSQTNWIRLKTGSSSQLIPDMQSSFLGVSLMGCPLLDSMQSHRSPCYDNNGCLLARLEARLSRPEADCVIC
ncbi:uncharacterized protein LAESUDRAFT_663965 [Laetiporus sulphureus 93-53]|uniref:Uncharacterized protein n=1 Tax=Laetiporus sulphureus 93-53 TaxID=1314785 RepID=A0A165BQK9_9APHY|nr:uncharacterized protein LAESUDRAFT_663965 [Laetiporus sulphureus 93-53]KZT01475.1 hypothetical protein LAESUDRAFT_663965 [Laetiporus sulphureus 93-53]